MSDPIVSGTPLPVLRHSHALAKKEKTNGVQAIVPRSVPK
jgi:hypothetical protein